jgi:hypothetical protein
MSSPRKTVDSTLRASSGTNGGHPIRRSRRAFADHVNLLLSFDCAAAAPVYSVDSRLSWKNQPRALIRGRMRIENFKNANNCKCAPTPAEDSGTGWVDAGLTRSRLSTLV